MRIPDPAGDWKASRIDPRLMLKRGHEDAESDGPFYNVMKEGMFLRYKPGKEVTMAPKRFLGAPTETTPHTGSPVAYPSAAQGPSPSGRGRPGR